MAVVPTHVTAAAGAGAGAGVPSNIAVLIGPQLVGILFNWMLYGILTIQVYIYGTTFPNDDRGIKLLVFGIYVVESLQTFFTTSDAFTWFVYGWGNPESILDLNFNWFDVPIMSGFVSMAVQCFFAWRVWILSQSAVLPIIIVLFSMMQGGAAIATGIKLRIIGSFAGVHTLYDVAIVWLIGSAVTDVIIAGAMTYFLLRAKTTVIPHTQEIIKRLVQLTVETGTLTASMTIVALILFQVLQDESLYLTPAMVFAKLYSNTLLAVFNNRAHFRAGEGTFVARRSTTFSISGLSVAADVSGGSFSYPAASPPHQPQSMSLQLRSQKDSKVMPPHMTGSVWATTASMVDPIKSAVTGVGVVGVDKGAAKPEMDDDHDEDRKSFVVDADEDLEASDTVALRGGLRRSTSEER